MKTVSIATRKKYVIVVVSVDDDNNDNDDENLFHATVYKFSPSLRVIMTSTCAVLTLEGGWRRKSACCLIILRWLQMFQNAGNYVSERPYLWIPLEERVALLYTILATKI